MKGDERPVARFARGEDRLGAGSDLGGESEARERRPRRGGTDAERRKQVHGLIGQVQSLGRQTHAQVAAPLP